MLRIFSDWKQRRQYRALSEQLTVLSSEVCRDIGIRRDDIETLRRGKDPWRD